MRYRTITAFAVLALAGALEAGCSSSSTPSSSSSSTTPAAATTAAAALPAADCSVIKPIAADALATLTPLQTESAGAQASAMTAYLTQLTADLAKVGSAQGKTDLGAFITALSHGSATSSASQTAITTSLAKLGTDCP